MKKDEIDDFGFTFADESEINEPVLTKKTLREGDLADALDHRTGQLRDLFAAIKPLLSNLKKDPQKEYIRWPNRIEKIEAFERRLEGIMRREREIDQ